MTTEAERDAADDEVWEYVRECRDMDRDPTAGVLVYLVFAVRDLTDIIDRALSSNPATHLDDRRP